MFAGLLPATLSFLRQTAPSLVATLIAAAMIAGYNHTFHLTQPRMAALQGVANAEPAAPPAATARPATSTVPMTKSGTGPVTEYITINETGEPERAAEKLPSVDAGRDQSPIKVASPAPVPAARPVVVAPRQETRFVEPRNAEPRFVEPRPAEPSREPRFVERRIDPPRAEPPRIYIPAQGPITQAPLGQVPAGPSPAGQQLITSAPAPSFDPPPVIPAGRPAYATVPDRPYQQQRPAHETIAEDVPPPPPPQGAIGMIVNTLKPSSIFARAREFGEKIEAAGNDILPNIRPQ